MKGLLHRDIRDSIDEARDTGGFPKKVPGGISREAGAFRKPGHSKTMIQIGQEFFLFQRSYLQLRADSLFQLIKPLVV